MSHGLFIDMLNFPDPKSGKFGNPVVSNMCFREPRVVLDKTAVARYFRNKNVPINSLYSRQVCGSHTSFDEKEELGRRKQILVIEDKRNVKNRLSLDDNFKSENMMTSEKKIIIEGSMFSWNDNLFGKINEFIAEKSTCKNSYLNCKNESDSADYHDFHNNTSTAFIKEESLEMECGDDILFTYGTDHDDENVENRNVEPCQMECGDDILFTNDSDYCGNSATATAESDEMECGDDILYTEGAGYYNSDEDSAEENQTFYDSHENAHKDEINIQNKQLEIRMKSTKSVIIETLDEQKEKECHKKIADYQELQDHIDEQKEKKCYNETMDQQELQDHIATYHSDFSSTAIDFVTCEECGSMFETLSLLKLHQLETRCTKYFYTCKFCSSTSWYSNILRKHIETLHKNKLIKENIDDVMKSIKESKQTDISFSNDTSFQKSMEKELVRPVPIQTIQKATKKPNNRKYIDYTEAKRLLKVYCCKCKVTPQATRKRILPYCSRCQTEFIYECLNCDSAYSMYNAAWKHAISCNKRPPCLNPLPQKVPKKYGKKMFYNAFCPDCKDVYERREHSIEEVCLKCRNYLEYQCEICRKYYKMELSVKRHAQLCHKKWQKIMINTSLRTFALIDHNYYCKNDIEPIVYEFPKVTKQPSYTEIHYKYQSVRKVYSGKKSRKG